MKKYGLRISLLVLGFAIGIGFVRLTNLSNYIPVNTNFNGDSAVVNGQYAEIGIKFKEFVQTENGLVADFEITNYSRDSYIYSANGKAEGLEAVYSQPDLMINGIKVEEWKCGTGYSDYDLKSGETKMFRYYLFWLGYIWKKGLSAQVGFNFRKRSFIVKEYQTYWSENLPITEVIYKKLLEQQYQKKKKRI